VIIAANSCGVLVKLASTENLPEILFTVDFEAILKAKL
jgi:hypothetical protein